jgi:hypothetical protein
VKVFLLTFNPITNLPQGVTHVDAARYMTFKLFRQLLGVRQNLKGRRHIAVIADVIRVLWLIDNGGGWFADGDMVCYDKFPVEVTQGHFFASMRLGSDFFVLVSLELEPGPEDHQMVMHQLVFYVCTC